MLENVQFSKVPSSNSTRKVSIVSAPTSLLTTYDLSLTPDCLCIPLIASPAGWHHVPSESKGGKDIFYYETRGNNVLAQDNLDGGNSMNGFRANGGKKMEFDFAIHMPKAGTPLDPHCTFSLI